MGNINARPILTPASHSPDPIGIIEHFRSIYESASYAERELDQMIRTNLVFITMKFQRHLLDGAIDHPATYFKEFRRLYRNLMRVSYGRHYYRKHEYLPLTYLCLDYGESRRLHRRQNGIHVPEAGVRGVYDRTRELADRPPYLKGESLHLHALMLMKPGYGQACREVIYEYAACADRDRLGLVDMQFPRPDRSLVQLASYSSKGVHEIATKTGKDAWIILPG